jgi:hypothetical protein
MTPIKKAAGMNQTAYKKSMQEYYNKNSYYNRIDLPHPADFYAGFFGNFRKANNSDWAMVRCCFHSPDKHPSLSVNFRTGAFRCWSCGTKGGGIIKFYQLLHNVDYKTAIQMLAAGR